MRNAKTDPFLYNQQNRKGTKQAGEADTQRHIPCQAIDNERNWGEDCEKDCLPCPKPSVKSNVRKIGQKRINEKLDMILDKNRRRCASWCMPTGEFVQQEDSSLAEKILAKDVFHNKIEAAKSPDFDTMPAALRAERAALPRCSSAPGPLKPGKLAKPRTVSQRPPGDRGNTTKSREAAHAYLENVASQRKVPHIPKCLQECGPAPDLAIGKEPGSNAEPLTTALDLRYANLTNTEATSIIMALKKQKGAFDALVMPGNSQLSDAIISKLLTHTAERARARGVKLLRLDFAGATLMGDTALTHLASAMRGEFCAVKYLRMTGVCVSERMWPILQGSMQALLRLGAPFRRHAHWACITVRAHLCR